MHTKPTNIENSGNPKCPSILHRIKPIGYTKTSIQSIYSFSLAIWDVVIR